MRLPCIHADGLKFSWSYAWLSKKQVFFINLYHNKNEKYQKVNLYFREKYENNIMKSDINKLHYLEISNNIIIKESKTKKVIQIKKNYKT